MDSIKSILKNFDPLQDKYISREFQAFGVHLCEKLEDPRRKSLYIKLAKTLPRPVLEAALRFVVDSHARNKGALFMWKLRELGIIGKESKSKGQAEKHKSPKAQKSKQSEVPDTTDQKKRKRKESTVGEKELQPFDVAQSIEDSAPVLDQETTEHIAPKKRGRKKKDLTEMMF